MATVGGSHSYSCSSIRASHSLPLSEVRPQLPQNHSFVTGFHLTFSCPNRIPPLRDGVRDRNSHRLSYNNSDLIAADFQEVVTWCVQEVVTLWVLFGSLSRVAH